MLFVTCFDRVLYAGGVACRASCAARNCVCGGCVRSLVVVLVFVSFSCPCAVCGVVVAPLQCLEVEWLFTVLRSLWLAPSELYQCAPSELHGCVAPWDAFVSAPLDVLFY